MRLFAAGTTLILLATAGCASRAQTGASGAALVTVVVHNPTGSRLPTQVCGSLGCSAFRDLAPGSTTRFRVDPGRTSRAVVTARRGTRIANFPVDFTPGETVHVALALP
ncbi:MAG TPA: hypothetical protein VE871_15675 [Longimicrobium sp.]|nr:hypothetical protein [Longimicrobium sp.]